MGSCPQSHRGRSHQEISRASWHHTLWKAGGDCRSDELSGIPGGEVDDRRFRAYGRRRDQGNLGRIATRDLTPCPEGTNGSRNEEEKLERRCFLGALAGASLGVLSEAIFTEFAKAQDTPHAVATPADQISFETSHVEVSGNTIFLRRYGKGPAILLVHGFPRTSLMWRFLAPKLAENHTVICADLRAYGRSGVPASTDDHFPYSKRAMAAELVGVMDKLGFPTFTLIGHDRGGRVSYRMALDHPKRVERLVVFDVIPILEAWNRSDARFAQTYWPWILLSQKAPLPE